MRTIGRGNEIPLAAMRSAPTMMALTWPAFINAAAEESAIKVAGILSCTSSYAVSLDPWKIKRSE